MDWKDLAKKITKIGAPLVGAAVGTAVGGPVVGGAAGAGIKAMIAGLFGVDPDDPDALDQAISADPQAAIKLREFELTHKVRLEEIVLEKEKAYLADRQDARAREVATTQATGKRDNALYLLAALVVAGFFFLCGALMYLPIPEGQNSVVLVLFGGLATGFTTVLAYFFGSSKGSADKNAMLQQGKKP